MGQTFQYTVTALLGTEPKQIFMIYNGETSVPHFDGLGVSTRFTLSQSENHWN
jgi:hypothetical protein